jgi:glutamyl-tRNA(Gln) amidotransferase subunit D
MCDNVALIYVHPNIKPSFIASLSEYDGVVLIGTGLGHVPTNVFNDKTVTAIYPQIKALVDSGIPVVMSPQTICGRLNMKVYTNGRFLLDAGVVGHNMDWTPESAYVKLCWVLGQTRNMKKIAELMTTNLVGEISSRTLPDLEVPL